jgi:hypothetical protein
MLDLDPDPDQDEMNADPQPYLAKSFNFVNQIPGSGSAFETNANPQHSLPVLVYDHGSIRWHLIYCLLGTGTIVLKRRLPYHLTLLSFK